MISLKNQKKKDTTPKILGGLSIPSGVALILVFIICLLAIFLPTFKPIKIGIGAIVLMVSYGIASFVDVSNKGMHNLTKKFFSKKVTAIKIKSLRAFKIKDDTQG